MMALVLSIVSLWVAPVLYRFARGLGHGIIERIMIAVLAVLVVLHMMPLAYQSAGWPVFLVALWGMLLPSVVERAWHSFAEQVHWVPFILGTAGLSIHAGIDGAALSDGFAMSSAASGASAADINFLPWAIVLHRLPEGLFIWWTLTPRFGWRTSMGVLMTITSFTILGYSLGQYFFMDVSLTWLVGLFQALVSGSLLHLALDWHDKKSSQSSHGHDHGGHSHRH